jgi:hypothetical protein
LLKIPSLEKGMKRDKVADSILLQFLLENNIENMRVVMNYLLISLSMYHTKNFLDPDIFSSVVDRGCPFNKITPVVKMHKWGESGFFKTP